jgi:hypothetical protein
LRNYTNLITGKQESVGDIQDINSLILFGRISLSDPIAKEFRDKYWEVEEITDENEIKENII